MSTISGYRFTAPLFGGPFIVDDSVVAERRKKHDALKAATGETGQLVYVEGEPQKMTEAGTQVHLLGHDAFMAHSFVTALKTKAAGLDLGEGISATLSREADKDTVVFKYGEGSEDKW